MAQLQGKNVSWQTLDAITIDKLQQMNDNISYLRDSRPLALYDPVKLATGVKMIAGISAVGSQTDDNATVRVTFGDFFSTGCVPVITTGLVSPLPRVHITLKGLNTVVPNEDGFIINVQMDNPDPKRNKLNRKVWVNWLAVGY